MNLSDKEKKQVKEVFLNETKDIIPQALADIKKLKDFDQKKLPKLLQRIERTLGNWRSDSQMVGYDSLSFFLLLSENLVERVSNGRIELTEKFIDLLEKVIKRIENTLNKSPEKINNTAIYDNLIKEMKDYVNISSYNKMIKKSQETGEDIKILIAEDDRTTRMITEHILGKYGKCYLAQNGEEAVSIFKEYCTNTESNYFDIIFMDIMMPKMDGIEAVKQIREFEEKRGVDFKDEVQITMFTVLDNPKSVFRSMYYAGASSYIVKNFTENIFRKELDKI